MNLNLNNSLRKSSYVFSIAILFLTSCMGQNNINTAKTSAAIPNASPDCNSSNTAIKEIPKWQGNALQNAVIRLNSSEVKKLLEQGSNINEKDNYGNTPLINAATRIIHEPKPKPRETVLYNQQKEAKLQLEIIQTLIKYGADVNQKDNYGKTAMIESVILDDSINLTILGMLIQHNADINAQDNQGFTPLMEAARTNRLEVVKLLLNNRAQKELKNCKGETALSIAQKYEFTEIAQILGQ